MKTYPYSRQWITEEDVQAVVDVLRSDWLTTGPTVVRFEEAFAAKVGARFAVTFANGTAALHGAYFAAGFKPKDEMIVPANTFLATANAACFLGVRPRFADLVPDTLCMDEDAVEALITPATRALVPVHFGGLPAALDRLKEVADRRKLMLIEDGCHALGAEYRGTKIGSCAYGAMTVFSFHPVKHITTGEGGMVTTNDERLYKRLKMFRNHGTWRLPGEMERNEGPWWYEMHELGFNYRLSDLNCALGLSQLARLDDMVRRRRKLADLYRRRLANHPKVLGFQTEPEGRVSSYHVMLVRFDFSQVAGGRRGFVERLKARGVLTQVLYVPVNEHPYYRKRFPDQVSATPRTHEYYEQGLAIPLFPQMTPADVDHVVKAVREELDRTEIPLTRPDSASGSSSGSADRDGLRRGDLSRRGRGDSSRPAASGARPTARVPVVIFTDGACIGNPGPAASAAVLKYKGRRKTMARYLGRSTNNVAELDAVRLALLSLRSTSIPVDIHSDSTYVIGVLSKGWKAKENKELIAEIRSLLARFDDVRFVKVPGHAGVPENELVDQLARDTIAKHA